jgi:HK97 family phage major capsid protein
MSGEITPSVPEPAAPAVHTMNKAELSDFVKGVWKDLGMPEMVDKIEEMKTLQSGWFEKIQGAPVSQEKKDVGVKKFGAFMRCLAATKGDVHRAAEYAKNKLGDEAVYKALAAADEAAGGFLVPEEFSAEIIDLLRPASIVRDLGATVVPLDTGTLRMPKQTAGASGGWIGENQNVPTSQPVFGQIVLSAKKYACLVPISNDLIRRGGPQVDALVRNDLVSDIATSTDLSFLRGAGVNGEPKGMKEFGNITNAQASPDLTKVTSDFASAIERMGTNNVKMIRLGCGMNWRSWRYLYTLRDGNGNFAFKPEMDSGSIMGIPFRRSSQIPSNLGSGDKSEIYIADMSDVIIGESTQVLLDVSTDAAYHDGSNVVAAFSMDQTVIRAIIEVDLGARYNESIEILDEVAWT